MKIKLMIDDMTYKVAKRLSVKHGTTISTMVRKGLLIYMSDPKGVEETAAILTDANAMKAIREGEEARRKGRKDYYIDIASLRCLS